MSPSSKAIGRLFDAGATSYDAARRNLLPCFDGFYESVFEIIGDWSGPAAPSVLDLGAGTGLLCAMALDLLPRARIHLVDVSESMLAEARRRFSGEPAAKVSFEVRDYTEGALGGPWDIVVSSLSIHHLADEVKRSVFERVFEALRPGGLFINADQVLGPSPAAEERYRRLWERAVLGSGIGRADYDRALERMLHDRCAPLEAQLGWLREAGFAEVDCAFKHWRFAVYFGLRP